MASPGEVKTSQQELILMLVRVLVFAATVLLVAGVVLILGLPGFVAGGVAALAAFGLMAGVNLFEVVGVNCPFCGRRNNVMKDTGFFRCPGCENEMYISKGKAQSSVVEL